MSDEAAKYLKAIEVAEKERKATKNTKKWL
jgi:hypothetical protein